MAVVGVIGVIGVVAGVDPIIGVCVKRGKF